MSKRAIKPCRNGSLIQFINCRILYRGAIVLDDLWVRDGKVCNPEQIFFDEKIQADLKIDCKNLIISPGFIDVQINGKFELSNLAFLENGDTIMVNNYYFYF